MKYLKTYEGTNKARRVYWIVPFDDRFEDAVVRTMIQYLGKENEVQNISVINDAFAFCNSARETNNFKDYVYLTMMFKYKPNSIKLEKEAEFLVFEYEEYLGALEDNYYKFIGYINCDKEELELYDQTNKYNI